MRKRYISAFLALSLILVLFAGCSGSKTEKSAEITSSPASAEPSEIEAAAAQTDLAAQGIVFPLAETYTFTVWDVFPPPLATLMEGPYDCTAVKELEKQTNVHLEYTVASTETATVMFNLMVASGDYCDLIYGVGDYYVGGADKAIDDGLVINLLDMSKSMPNFQSIIEENPAVLELTPNGQMYHFPVAIEKVFNEAVNGFFTRGDWLEKLGISDPVTYDDFEGMLAAFKSDMGADGALLIDSNGFSGAVASGFGVTNGFYQVDGKIKYGPMESGFKDYISYVQSLYSQGLIYKDFYSLVGPPTDYISSGDIAVWNGEIGSISSFTSGITEAGYKISGIPYPVAEAGEKTHFSGQTQYWEEGMAVSTDCDNLELLAQLINYMYGDDFSFVCNYGAEGEAFNYNDEGKPVFTDLIINNKETLTKFAVWKYTLFGYLPHKSDQTRMESCYTQDQLDIITKLKDNADSEYSLPLSFTLSAEDEATVANIMTDAETYIEESLLGYITGTLSLSDYDAFLDKLNTINVQEAIDIYQKTYDEQFAG